MIQVQVVHLYVWFVLLTPDQVITTLHPFTFRCVRRSKRMKSVAKSQDDFEKADKILNNELDIKALVETVRKSSLMVNVLMDNQQQLLMNIQSIRTVDHEDPKPSRKWVQTTR